MEIGFTDLWSRIIAASQDHWQHPRAACVAALRFAADRPDDFDAVACALAASIVLCDSHGVRAPDAGRAAIAAVKVLDQVPVQSSVELTEMRQQDLPNERYQLARDLLMLHYSPAQAFQIADQFLAGARNPPLAGVESKNDDQKST